MEGQTALFCTYLEGNIFFFIQFLCIFSAPGQRSCELLPSLGVCHPWSARHLSYIIYLHI